MAMVQKGQQNVPMAQVNADESFNVRKKYTGIDELAEDIRKNGLYNPLMVTAEGEGYRLLGGFRRFKALQKLGREIVPVNVYEFTGDAQSALVDAKVLNLSENLARADLSRFEVAERMLDLMETGNLSAAQLAQRFSGSQGYSRSNINNLTSAMRTLHPTLLKAWEAGHAQATNENLFALKALDKDEQLAEWAKMCGAAGTSAEPEAPEATDPKAKARKKSAKPEIVALAIRGVNDSRLNESQKDIALACLKWVVTGGKKPLRVAGVLVWDPAEPKGKDNGKGKGKGKKNGEKTAEA